MNKLVYKIKKFIYKRSFRHTVGIALAVIGCILIIQVVPLTVWLIMLGLLLIGLGWTFFKML